MYSISLEGYVVWLFHIGLLVSVIVGLVYYGSVSTQGISSLYNMQYIM